MTADKARFTIVGLGEALFDVFPHAEVLGGAPLNCAVHADQLARTLGGRGVVVSRIGQDALGGQLKDELSSRGMTTEFIQEDPDRSTGKVFVTTSASGEPQYEIVKNVAWDWMQFDPDDETLATGCDAVCFGTLAQRSAQARSSIQRFVKAASHAVRMFDVNLRQDFYDKQVISHSMELANAVKINSDELGVVAGLLGIVDGGPDSIVNALIKKFELKSLALTRGAEGTVLYTPDARVEGDQVSYDRADNADSVGAGDSCAACLLIGLVQRWPLEKTVNLANHVGAYVASQPGATPALPDELLEFDL